jgi:hypothetical protein
MVTKVSGENSPLTHRRELNLLQFSIYRRIVERKHGLSVPLTPEALADMSDEDLASYVDSLKDMAHLPAA